MPYSDEATCKTNKNKKIKLCIAPLSQCRQMETSHDARLWGPTQNLAGGHGDSTAWQIKHSSLMSSIPFYQWAYVLIINEVWSLI